MDLYGDDIDSLLGIDELNQNINTDPYDGNDIAQGTGEKNDEDEDEDKNDDDENNKPGVAVEAKKRAVRNPQLRLNVERLKSDRGIQAIDDYFTDLKFHGKGYEKHDLNNIMKRLEHWAHRLYPKYNFDDFIETTEKLGKKKQIQTYMNMYRQGLLEKVAAPIEDDEGGGNQSDNEMNGNNEREPIDEFDDLIGQQIEKYRTLPPRTPGHETTFDTIRSPSSNRSSSVLFATPSFSSRAAIASTPMSDIYPLPPSPMPSTSNGNQTPTLSSDQMARVAENRRLAQERLRAKREAAAAVITNQHPDADEPVAGPSGINSSILID